MHRYRIAFLSGLAAGFILGARAGRERYEQIKKLARRTADSPAVQQAAGALQAQATGMLKSATHKVVNEVHGRVPWLGDGVRQKVANHIPGQRARDASASTRGAESGPEAAGRRPFAATSERSNGRSAS